MDNEHDETSSNNLALYLFFVVSLVLVLVDGIGLFHILIQWQQSSTISDVIFDDCLKWQLISKTCFTAFSLCTALSALILCIFLLIDAIYFVDKVLNTYLYYNYFIFGPVLLGLSVLGLINWDNIVNVCKLDNGDIKDKVFSLNNMFSIFLCFILSITTSLLVTIYKTVNLYADSLTNSPDGIGILKRFIYWVALKTSSPTEIIRRYQRSEQRSDGIVVTSI